MRAYSLLDAVSMTTLNIHFDAFLELQMFPHIYVRILHRYR
jgi:hypothetical protein